MNEIGTIAGAYFVPAGKSYSAYVSNTEWDAFIKDMEINHASAFEEYGAGSGGELKPKGKYPPKMASYGSSSRMIYNLCKDIPNFHFEYQLPTRVGGVANLDGFMESDNKYIFVEAKCREPYSAKSHLIENKYQELYKHINKDKACNLSIQTENCDSKMKVMFSVGEHKIESFDIKQMICHLLGITVKFLRTPTDKRITFLYLCYNPKLIEIVEGKKKESILATYNQMCEECNAIDFSALFKSIVMYLSEELKVGHATDTAIDTMLANFNFFLCDQSTFLSQLE
jgi:hypothetical protein